MKTRAILFIDRLTVRTDPRLTTVLTSSNKTDSPTQVSPSLTSSQNCKTWSDNLDTRQAGIDRTREVIDQLYQASQTGEELDVTYSEVAKYNTERELNVKRRKILHGLWHYQSHMGNVVNSYTRLIECQIAYEERFQIVYLSGYQLLVLHIG